jgi:squalene-hopene/tetraprenyl-beta-curcumene cyclase
VQPARHDDRGHLALAKLRGDASRFYAPFAMKLPLLLALLSVASAVAAEQAAPSSDERSWDPAAAAAYLDMRMDLWFTYGRKLKTGDGQATCVACHAGLAYAIARPVLRDVLQVNVPSPQEARLIGETTRRVETYGTHELLYEFNERKQIESRGTEAVLNAVILTSADAARNLREPSEPTKKALARLWETQRADGAWDWLDFRLEPWETVDSVYHGATYAAFAVGTAKGRRDDAAATSGIARLRAYLSANYESQHLYNRTWALLASTRLGNVITDAQREALIAELIGAQRSDGGWSLYAMGPWRWSKNAPPFNAPGELDESLLSQSDGYATGLVVYTLKQAGVSSDHPAIRKGIQWLEKNQRAFPVPDVPGRGWPAYSLNYDREHGSPHYDADLRGDKGEPWRRLFMADTATAFAILALANGE